VFLVHTNADGSVCCNFVDPTNQHWELRQFAGLVVQRRIYVREDPLEYHRIQQRGKISSLVTELKNAAAAIVENESSPKLPNTKATGGDSGPGQSWFQEVLRVGHDCVRNLFD